MKPTKFKKTSSVPCSTEELCNWHHSPGAFKRLCPPWEQIQIIKESPIKNGNRNAFSVRIGPYWWKWVAEYQAVKTGTE